MSSEPLLAYLRRSPVSHPLSLPDTAAFLFRGELSHSPFLNVRPKPFRSTLEDSLSAKLADAAAGIRKVKRKKAWARLACRQLSCLQREEARGAARNLVRNGTHREEVEAGLLFLLFLAEPEDLEDARTLAQNEAFTPYSLGIIARFSDSPNEELLDLLVKLERAAKAAVVAMLLRRPTPRTVELALDHGFPKLEFPMWRWRWRDPDYVEELEIWGETGALWIERPELRDALLSRPRVAARVACLFPEQKALVRDALARPRIIEHFFLDQDCEQNWEPFVVEALGSEDTFVRRQGWTIARRLGMNIDRIASERLSQNPDDFVGWEETISFLSTPQLLEQVEIEPHDGQPTFELGLDTNQWARARVLESVLRGISRFPGLRPDLVSLGLEHPVISVRLASLGCLACWPNDSFYSRLHQVAARDPVWVVRQMASRVTERKTLRPQLLRVLQQALSEFRGPPAALVSQLTSVYTLRQSERDYGILGYAEFAHSQTQPGAEIFEQETSEGFCVVSTDPSRRWLRWIELL